MYKILILTCALIPVVFICHAEVINVPLDYTTIQEGIDASVNGDTVLVQPGAYIENINFNGKNITLGSLFLTTQDTSYISQTVIDGDSSGSVVTFVSGEDSTALLAGFMITNGCGDGGGIYCYDSDPVLRCLNVIDNFVNVHSHLDGGAGVCFVRSNACMTHSIIRDNVGYDKGGGVYCEESDIKFESIIIKNNSATSVNSFGGGIESYESDLILKNVKLLNNKAALGGAIFSTCSNIDLENVDIVNNSASMVGGGLYNRDDSSVNFSDSNRCTIHSNKILIKGAGCDIYSGCLIDVIVDTFSVVNPTDYYTSPLENFTFDIEHGILDQIDADLYVSPYGSNSNSGLTFDDPLQTLHYATSVIISDSLNSHTIYLADGIYSPSNNGEEFPINVPDGVSIIGNSMDETILDAENTSRVMTLVHLSDTQLLNLTLMNGNSIGGSGMYISNSNIILENVIVKSNIGVISSGIYSLESDLMLDGVVVCNNISERSASIFHSVGDITIQNSSIINNTNQNLDKNIDVSGIYLARGNIELINSIVADNTGGYGVYEHSGETNISYSNFWDNELGNFYGLNDSIGVNVTTNTNGDSCDVFYNIQMNPLFVDPANGDYHLSWTNYPVQDSTKSPCIDAGDPNSSLDPDGTVADMGAYYFDQTLGVGPDPEYHEISLINYPNPFQRSTTISFAIPQATKVKLQIYNIRGQLVEEILNDDLQSGEGTLEWDSGDYPSGVYFYKLSTPQTSVINKMVIMK